MEDDFNIDAEIALAHFDADPNPYEGTYSEE